MIEELLGLLGMGAFGLVFITAFVFSIIEFLGKIYGTYDSLIREDLTGEQRIIYLVGIWLIPFGWVIYLLLGKEKTSELFQDIKFL